VGAPPDDWLHPVLARAIADGAPMAAARAVGPGLWELPTLSDGARARVAAECAAIAAWNAAHGHPLEPPNSMNEAGFRLAPVGLAGLASWLMDRAVSPLADGAFAASHPWALEDPHGFTVAYGAGADRDLGFHVDDSAVTLNLCLERTGAGGEVWFAGSRCALHRQDPGGAAAVWAPRPGWALLHRGAHRHGAWPVQGGHRRNLVVWCRDAAARQREHDDAEAGRCPPWCGHPAEP